MPIHIKTDNGMEILTLNQQHQVRAIPKKMTAFKRLKDVSVSQSQTQSYAIKRRNPPQLVWFQR